MAYETEEKSSADLQREVEMQRNRVESTIDQIQARLSPGQMVDELLAYTKGGGSEFVSTLQRQVTSNPLPVALLGVSLAWLMAKPAHNASDPRTTDRKWDDSINENRGYGSPSDRNDYPVAVITGNSLRLTGTARDDTGKSYREFTDAAGKKFKALSDDTGKRAGHFVDETGATFRGFTNSAGSKVEHFRDEAGELVADAADWASHTWQSAREKLTDVRDNLTAGSGSVGAKASQAGEALRQQADSLNRTILTQFRDQSLIGGALAFAVGAALAASLPHTPQEDALLGEAADAVKAKAGEQAVDVYEQAKDKASELYENASHKVGEIYDQAKEGLSTAVGNAENGEDYSPTLHP